MGILPCTTLTLGLALAASVPVFAAPLEGGAVAAPNQYGADVAAQILRRAATRWTLRWPRPSPWP